MSIKRPKPIQNLEQRYMDAIVEELGACFTAEEFRQIALKRSNSFDFKRHEKVKVVVKSRPPSQLDIGDVGEACDGNTHGI